MSKHCNFMCLRIFFHLHAIFLCKKEEIKFRTILTSLNNSVPLLINYVTLKFVNDVIFRFQIHYGNANPICEKVYGYKAMVN